MYDKDAFVVELNTALVLMPGIPMVTGISVIIVLVLLQEFIAKRVKLTGVPT